MRFEIIGCLDRISSDSFGRFGPVRKAGGIAKIDVIGYGNDFNQRAKNSKSPKAGIENSDSRTVPRNSMQIFQIGLRGVRAMMPLRWPVRGRLLPEVCCACDHRRNTKALRASAK